MLTDESDEFSLFVLTQLELNTDKMGSFFLSSPANKELKRPFFGMAYKRQIRSSHLGLL